jgi:maleate isomerase
MPKSRFRIRAASAKSTSAWQKGEGGVTRERETEDGRGLRAASARLGVILPSSNRLIEPQFAHFAPAALGVHFSRARITGKWARPLAELGPEVARAADTLADAKPDLILFHCAATSMMEGPQGEASLLGLIEHAAGRPAMSTAGAVSAALQALGARRLALITPYVQATNDHEKRYLAAQGFHVVRDVALGLPGGDEYIKVTPERWVEIALAADHADVDVFFMSCTNTRQIEAIEAIEQATGKPAVSANQAALWACVGRLAPALDASTFALPGRLGRIA